MADKLLDIASAADLLSVSKSFLYQAVETNKIPHYRIGIAIRFSRERLLDYFSGDNYLKIKEHSNSIKTNQSTEK